MPTGRTVVVCFETCRVDSDHVRNIEQIGKRRWNHQIVVRTLEDARSEWLAKLIRLAFDYGAGS